MLRAAYPAMKKVALKILKMEDQKKLTTTSNQLKKF